MVCHHHKLLSFCRKKYITQITKLLSLILPIILVKVGILREVITSVITSCILVVLGIVTGLWIFAAHKYLWKINVISKWKEKEDSVAMLNALLQKYALSYSKWLLELHCFLVWWPCSKNKCVVQHTAFASLLQYEDQCIPNIYTYTPQIP